MVRMIMTQDEDFALRWIGLVNICDVYLHDTDAYTQISKNEKQEGHLLPPCIPITIVSNPLKSSDLGATIRIAHQAKKDKKTGRQGGIRRGDRVRSELRTNALVSKPIHPAAK